MPQPYLEDLPPDRIRDLLAARPGFFYTSPRYYRDYPNSELACHVLGYVGRRAPLRRGPVENGDSLFTEEEGKDGLEKMFDATLSGRPGTMTVSVDQSATVAHRRITTPPIPGKNVVTAIDMAIQRVLEEEMPAAGSSASVVVDPRTGDILAALSRPGYPPPDMAPSRASSSGLGDDPSAPLLPRVFRASYPPASAFKPFVALAAMSVGAVSPEEELGCPPSLDIGNMVFRNWSASDLGQMDVSAALASSCNTWFYRAALRAGPAAILRTAAEYGFGSAPQVSFPLPESGLLPDNEYMTRRHGRRMSQGDTANIGIGQGDLLVTPLQMAMAYAALGNGGTLWRPRLVLQVQEIDNSVVAGYPAKQVRRVPCPPSALEAVVRGLEMAVESGTARGASVKGLKVAGKTGTAQWGPPSEKKHLAWFCGFAPSPHPRVAFAFLVEGTPGQSLAGADAAALAGRVLRKLKPVLAPTQRSGEPSPSPQASGSPEPSPPPDSPAPTPPHPEQKILPAIPVEAYEAPAVDIGVLSGASP